MAGVIVFYFKFMYNQKMRGVFMKFAHISIQEVEDFILAQPEVKTQNIIRAIKNKSFNREQFKPSNLNPRGRKEVFGDFSVSMFDTCEHLISYLSGNYSMMQKKYFAIGSPDGSLGYMLAPSCGVDLGHIHYYPYDYYNYDPNCEFIYGGELEWPINQ